jgi:hypothetical protein
VSDDVKVEVDSGGCLGCLSIIVFVFALWALLFGVTYKGKHYGLQCSPDKGVEVLP